MELSFTLTKKDYWAYNKYTLFHIWPITRIFILTPVIIAVIALVAGLIFKAGLLYYAFAVVGLPLFYVASIFIPMYRGVMKIPADQLQPQTLKIDREKRQLIRTVDKKVDKFNKDNVYKFRRERDHIFITMTSYSSLIIPKTGGIDLDAVMEELEKIL